MSCNMARGQLSTQKFVTVTRATFKLKAIKKLTPRLPQRNDALKVVRRNRLHGTILTQQYSSKNCVKNCQLKRTQTTQWTNQN